MNESLSFDTLYVQYAPLVRRRVRSLLARYPGEIEDVVQDTFVKVWRSLSRVTPDWNMTAWILRIATNTALDVLKSPRIQRCQSLDRVSRNEYGSEHTLADMLPETQDHFQAVELQETLEYLRRHLPASSLNALALAAQGYEISEMATLFHVSRGRVKNLLCQVRAAARHAAQQQPA
jgi:RNA polymerase sigma-70 factor (ECF subfamily)